MIRSSEQGLGDGETCDGIGCRQHVIEHHSKAVLVSPVEPVDRHGFDDIEEAEGGEGRRPPRPVVRHGHQHGAERDDFVPDDAAMVGHAERLPGNFTQHTPPNKENDQGCDLCCKGQGRKEKEEREERRKARARTLGLEEKEVQNNPVVIDAYLGEAGEAAG